jgi:ribosomal-protein-alanine N-acetyltransferase
MKIHIETERLIMRDLTEQDTQGMFELDSEPEVHTYLGNNPIKTLNEAEKNIAFIKEQYEKNGIGRWAVIEKKTGDFIGWSGFKLITDVVNNRTQFYDLGYRFIKKAWGKGYATETAIASLDFGFNQLNQKEICAIADIENLASNRILQKIGMSKVNKFDYENLPHNFYIMKKNEWNKSRIANTV